MSVKVLLGSFCVLALLGAGAAGAAAGVDKEPLAPSAKACCPTGECCPGGACCAVPRGRVVTTCCGRESRQVVPGCCAVRPPCCASSDVPGGAAKTNRSRGKDCCPSREQCCGGSSCCDAGHCGAGGAKCCN